MKTDYTMDYLANQQADKLATFTHNQINKFRQNMNLIISRIIAYIITHSMNMNI